MGKNTGETPSSMAYDAYRQRYFAQAVDYMTRHLEQEPDDGFGWGAQGDYLTCAGRLRDATEAYARSVKNGADARDTARRLARTVNLLAFDATTPPGEPYDAAKLLEACRPYCPPRLEKDLEAACRALVEECNPFRAALPERLAHYDRVLDLAGETQDMLFVVPPYIRLEAGYPLYGISVLTEYLRRHGKSTRIADLNLALWEMADPSLREWWRFQESREPYGFETEAELLLRPDIDALAAALAGAPAKTLGFVCLRFTLSFTLKLLPKIKSLRPDARIVLGGPSCMEIEQVLEDYASVLEHIDAAVIGEGEIAVHDYLEALDAGKPTDCIPGVFAPRKGQTAAPESFRLPPPVDAAELRGFARFDRSYLARIPEPRRRFIATNRSCVNRCDFCQDHLRWRRFRVREPADVADEIEYSVREHGIRRFELVDLACNASPKHLEALCDLLIEKNLDVEIASLVMVSSKMTRALYEKMLRAGFATLALGLETGSESVRKAIGKRESVETAAENLRLAAQAGLRTKVCIIVGHPAEGRKEFKETLRFLQENKAHIHETSLASPCTIMRNTILEDKMLREGVRIPQGWSHYSSWTLGDNTPMERKRRREELNVWLRDIGIPICETPWPDPPPTLKTALVGLIKRAGKRLKGLAAAKR